MCSEYSYILSYLPRPAVTAIIHTHIYLNVLEELQAYMLEENGLLGKSSAKALANSKVSRMSKSIIKSLLKLHTILQLSF